MNALKLEIDIDDIAENIILKFISDNDEPIQLEISIQEAQLIAALLTEATSAIICAKMEIIPPLENQH